jgi:hypothetical protein
MGLPLASKDGVLHAVWRTAGLGDVGELWA